MLNLLSSSDVSRVDICLGHGVPWDECEDCSEDPEAPTVGEKDGILVEFVVVMSILRPNGLRAMKAVTQPGAVPHSTRGLLMNAADTFTG